MKIKVSALFGICLVAMFSLSLVSLYIGLRAGYERGFDACIEENNLYDLYED